MGVSKVNDQMKRENVTKISIQELQLWRITSDVVANNATKIVKHWPACVHAVEPCPCCEFFSCDLIGLKENLILPPPVNVDPATMTGAEQKLAEVDRLPESLEAAMTEVNNDQRFLAAFEYGG